MLDGFKLSLRFLKNQVNKNKERFNPVIPSSGTPTNQIKSFYDKVSDMTYEFNQRSISDYDIYLINDALGVPNVEKKQVLDFNGA